MGTNNFWQDDIEEIFDKLHSGSRHKHTVVSLLMVRICGVKGNTAELAVSKLGDSSVYKVVMMIRKGAIRHSLVPKYSTTSSEYMINLKKKEVRTHGYEA